MTTKTLGIVPIGMLVLAAVIYALVFPMNKFAAEAGATPLGNAFWQTLVGGLALLIASALRGDPVSFRWPYLRAYLVVGIFGFGLPPAIITMVSHHLPSSLISLAFALSPTCTYGLSVILRLDRFSVFGLVGIALGFAGVAMILAPEDSGIAGGDQLLWFLLTLVIPLLLAVTNVSAAVLRPPATSSTVMGAGFLLGAAISTFPLMFIFGQAYAPTDMGTLMPTLGAAAVNAVFIVLFAEIVNRYGPTFFAQFNYLMVVAAIGWAALLFGEAAGLYTWLALALMALGVVISEFRHRNAGTSA